MPDSFGVKKLFTHKRSEREKKNSTATYSSHRENTVKKDFISIFSINMYQKSYLYYAVIFIYIIYHDTLDKYVVLLFISSSSVSPSPNTESKDSYSKTGMIFNFLDDSAANKES